MRKIKPLKIDTIFIGKLDLFVPIFFDKTEKEFFVEWGTEKVTSTDLGVIRRTGREFLEKMQTYDWKEFIDIESSFQDGNDDHFHCFAQEGVEFKFSYDRLEVSPNPMVPGGRVQRAHPLDCVDLPKGREPKIAKLYEHGRPLLPYSEATWNALGEIRNSIVLAGKKLEMLLGDPKLESKLLAFAASAEIKLLGGGK